MKMSRLFVGITVLCLLIGCVAGSITVAASSNVVAEGTCGQGVTWVLTEDGTLTVSGNGAMDDYPGSDFRPWVNLDDKIYSVVIKDGVTRVGARAFSNVWNLTSIKIGDSVTEIGDSAFMNGFEVTTLRLGKNVKTIGESAFLAFWKLTSLELPEGLTSIGRSAFSGGAMRTVTMPASVTYIDSHAFNDCTSLTDVYYGGTKAQWAQISILEYNEPLKQATLHPTHSWDAGTVSKHPDCKELGEMTYTCTDCRETKTEPIDKEPHTYDNACDTACNRCGATRTVNHSYGTTWSKDGKNHWRKCTVCSHTDTAAHKPGAAATEQRAQLCTVCGYEIQAKLEHVHKYGADWVSDAAQHWHVCSCGAQSDKAEHSWDAGNDGQDGLIHYRCEICGAEKTEQKPETPTEPTTVATEPSIPSTEPSSQGTEPSTVPSAPAGSASADGESDAFPWTAVVAVVTVAAIGGGGAAFVLIRKRRGV